MSNRKNVCVFVFHFCGNVHIAAGYESFYFLEIILNLKVRMKFNF